MITANGFPVVDGQLVTPRVGAWHADLVVQNDVAMSGACEIAVDGGVTFKGTVLRGGLWQQTAWVRVAAGAGGVNKTARAEHYNTTSIRAVATDIARAGGEALSAASDATVLGMRLASYTQLANPVGLSLSALLNVGASELSWRYLADGTIRIGTETWPDSGLADPDNFQDLDERPQEGFAKLGLEVPGIVLPGTLIGGRKVSYVTNKFDGGKSRAYVLFED